MKQLTPEGWIGVWCAILFVLFILYLLTACTPHTRVQDIEIIWHDGECLFVADGMTIEQAKDLQQTWKFEQCKIEITDNEKE